MSPIWKEKDPKWFLLFFDLLHGLCYGVSQSSFDTLFVCLFVCFYFVLRFFFFFWIKKGKIINIQKQCVCVYWYLCTFDGLWNKVSQLCITCSLDEDLHVQLSNVSFVARFMWFVWFGWSFIFHIFNHSFWWEGLGNLKRKA